MSGFCPIPKWRKVLEKKRVPRKKKKKKQKKEKKSGSACKRKKKTNVTPDRKGELGSGLSHLRLDFGGCLPCSRLTRRGKGVNEVVLVSPLSVSRKEGGIQVGGVYKRIGR